MTEKRFKEVFPDIIESSCSFTDNGKGITHKEVVDLLNKLNDENEQLKHDATVLIQANQDYRRENEQLKKEIKSKDKIIELYYEMVKE